MLSFLYADKIRYDTKYKIWLFHINAIFLHLHPEFSEYEWLQFMEGKKLFRKCGRGRRGQVSPSASCSEWRKFLHLDRANNSVLLAWAQVRWPQGRPLRGCIQTAGRFWPGRDTPASLDFSGAGSDWHIKPHPPQSSLCPCSLRKVL